MRLTFTIGRFTIYDFKIFEIEDKEMIEPDVIVVHHHEEEDDDEGPDLFGGKR